MKLYEEIDSDSLNTQRYSIYHLNRADNFLIKNSIKFFLFNTSEKNLENSLQQYKLYYPPSEMLIHLKLALNF